MSQVLDNIKSRRSVRKFKDDAVPQDLLDKIIEAGLYAPSSRGKQGTVIVQITDKKMRSEFVRENAQIGGWADGFDPFYNAPAILLVLGDKNNANRVYDGSLVMENMMLEAHDLDLGTCWIHRAKEEFESEWGKNLLKSIGIEGEWEGIGHCAVGYTDGDYPSPYEIKSNRVYYIR